MYTRKYNLKARKEYKTFPEKCDLCRQWFQHMNYFNPVKKSHNLDDLHLCDHCKKQIFEETNHT